MSLLLKRENSLTDAPAPVLDHLGGLRSRILASIAAVIVGAFGANFFSAQIIHFFLVPVQGQNLVFLSPLDPLILIIKVDIYCGLVIAFPIISFCFFSFIRPAIGAKKTRIIVSLYISSLVLVVFAAAYSYYLMLPISLKFLLSISIPGIVSMITATNYLNFFLVNSLILGIAFQTPLLIIMGVYLGIFQIQTLTSKRRYVYLFGLIFFSAITPTTDLFSLAIVTLPALVLFEISVLIATSMEKSSQGRVDESLSTDESA